MNIDKLETEYLNQNQIDEASQSDKERLIVLLMMKRNAAMKKLIRSRAQYFDQLKRDKFNDKRTEADGLRAASIGK